MKVENAVWILGTMVVVLAAGHVVMGFKFDNRIKELEKKK